MNSINKIWPKNFLESVSVCPYCRSSQRKLAYKNIQDWSFYVAPGKWDYWDCESCKALYLDPRPIESSLNLIYKSYYTHNSFNKLSLLQRLKQSIRNEYWSHLFSISLNKKFKLPKLIYPILKLFKSRMKEPFGLFELASHPKGFLLDVGCGNGYMMDYARKLGWNTIGIEIDPNAVASARSDGFDVIQGTYRKLDEFRAEFDCIICSHVCEHVYDPIDLIEKLANALKPKGVLLLSMPNSTSSLRYFFAENWRGLEAPRHLSIPSMNYLKSLLEKLGFVVNQSDLSKFSTAIDSFRIKRRGLNINASDVLLAKTLESKLKLTEDDFIQFVCIKK